ncbi:MAG: DUF551 domain-containing protein [Candidatus Omnitrophica bacterium]|nr:DUF551 domain-containing protein [Candidatus Omnitrophota bacterium]
MPFEWIDIKKQKPEHEQAVLIAAGHVVTAAIAELSPFSDAIWWDGCHFSGHRWDWDFDEKDITHWMPMPKPPNVEKEKE